MAWLLGTQNLRLVAAAVEAAQQSIDSTGHDENNGRFTFRPSVTMELYGFTNVMQLLQRVYDGVYDGVVVIEAVLEPILFSMSKKVAFATKGIVQRKDTCETGEEGNRLAVRPH